MAVYALYAHVRLGYAPRNIRCILAYLRSGTFERHNVTEPMLADARAFIRASVREMQQLLIDPKHNTPRPDAFPTTEGDRACSLCSYQAVFHPNAHAAGTVPSTPPRQLAYGF